MIMTSKELWVISSTTLNDKYTRELHDRGAGSNPNNRRNPMALAAMRAEQKESKEAF
jgi:hypothetical protein